MDSWKSAKDATGRTYYYNSAGVVQWEDPNAAVKAEATPSGYREPLEEKVRRMSMHPPLPKEAVVEDEHQREVAPTSAPSFASAAPTFMSEAPLPLPRLPAFVQQPTTALAPGWKEAKDGSGKTYYYSTSGAVQWDPPYAAGAGSPPPPTPAWGAPRPPPTQAKTVIVINNSTSKLAQQQSGWMDVCGCCGSCEWVQVTVDEDRVETLRQERGCCVCCDPAEKTESVEFSQLQSIVGVEGWVMNTTLVILSIFIGFLPAGFLFAISDIFEGEIAAGVGFVLLGLGLFGLGCCREARLRMDTMHDARPFETDGIATSSLPHGQFNAVWENLKRGWQLNRQGPAPTVTVVEVTSTDTSTTATVSGGGATVKEWAGGVVVQPNSQKGGFDKPLTATIPLGLNSSFHISKDGFVEVKERCCLVKTRSLTWANNIRWVRMPSSSACNCCSSVQIGTNAEEHLEAPMDGMNATGLTNALKRVLLNRPTAKLQGAINKFAACGPRPDCTCPRLTIEVDNDFVTQTSQASCCCPGSTVLYRTEDVNWVYSEKSAKLWCLGICSLLNVLFLFVIVCTVIALAATLSFQLVAGVIIVAPLLLLVGNCFGLISFSAICSLCYKFTVVTFGTPGSASVEEGGGDKPGPCCFFLWCCCFPLAFFLFLKNRLCRGKTSSVKVYNCDDSTGSLSTRFVAATRLNITAANHAVLKAAAAGKSGEGKE